MDTRRLGQLAADCRLGVIRVVHERTVLGTRDGGLTKQLVEGADVVAVDLNGNFRACFFLLWNDGDLAARLHREALDLAAWVRSGFGATGPGGDA